MRLSVVVLTTLLTVGAAFSSWLGITSPTPTIPRIEINPDGNNATIIEITIPGLETETKEIDGENWTVVQIPGEPAITGKVGLPQLPVVVRNLALPDNATVDVSVVESEFEKVSGVLIYPTQKPLTECEQPVWQVDETFYQKDLVYPSELATVKLQSTWRGLPFATIEINPVRYNPAKRELFITKKQVVQVNHAGVFRRKVIEPWTLGVLKNAYRQSRKVQPGRALD
ncbi:hypothetical protein HPY86_01295 [candidate division WOR-3 bacterium]|jgi:hypothetical protein|nr:hypothetical protein [candidate division WOR-3 bacterium]